MKKLAFLLLILLVFCAIPCTSYAEATAAPAACEKCGGNNFPATPDCTEDHKNATCTTQGCDCYICIDCGTHNYVYTPATGHKEGEPQKIQHSYSSYITKGQYDTEVHCTVCGDLLSSVSGEDPLLEVESITIALSPDTIKVGEATTATANILPEAAGKPSPNWSIESIDNKAIATIDSNGYIIGKSAGNAIITAEAGGKTAIKALLVLPKTDPVPPTYHVTVRSGGGGTVTGEGDYTVGSSVTISATPSSDEYVFSKWEIGSATVFDNPYSFTVNGPVTANAVFTKKPAPTTYHVTVRSGGGGTVTGEGDYTAGTTATIRAEADSEHVFSRWEIGSGTSFANPYSFVVNEAVVATAIFAPKPDLYTITYRPGTDCAGTAFTDSWEAGTAYLAGQSFFKNNYTQTGWSLTQGGGKAYDLEERITLTKDLTLYPYWTKNAGTLKLTVNYSGEGVVYLNGTKITSGTVYDISEGRSITFTMTPNSEDYYVYSINFAGKYWNANVDTDKFMVTYEMMKAEDRTLTIKFDSVTASPKTGDSSNILLWSCLFGLSAAAVTAGMVLKKKSKS